MKGFGKKQNKKVEAIKIDLVDLPNLKRQAFNYLNNGKCKKAEKIYIQCLREGVNDEEIYFSLSTLYKSRGEIDKAIKYLKKVLEISSDNYNLYFNLGLLFLEQDKLNEAIDSYKKGLEIDPNNLPALLNLANIYEENLDLESAIEIIEKCFSLHENDPKVIFAYGNILQSQGKYDESLEQYKKVVLIDQNFLEAKVNIGNILHKQGRIDESLKFFKDLIKEKGSNPKLEQHLSHLLLLSGNYNEGLEKYESRLKVNKKNYIIPRNLEMLENKEFSENQKLLVLSEQGLGDTIQFSRYLIPLRNKGIDIVFCVQEKLKELIKVSNLANKVYSKDYIPELLNAKWIPLLSIPRILGVTPNNPILNKPYIKPPEKKIYEWGKYLRINKKPIVGINWQGNPETEKSHLKGRSLNLDLFREIALQDINLISLQKGFGTEQIDKSSFKNKFHKYQNEITQNWDFIDNASIIFNCDLVITNDTVVAHLSGAMGKETWLLLQKIPDWRWGINSEKSFWYPSVRIFRQEKLNNWNKVLKKVTLELNSFLLNYG